MQIVCYIKKEKDANKCNLINIEVFKSITKMPQNIWGCNKKLIEQSRLIKPLKAS